MFITWIRSCLISKPQEAIISDQLNGNNLVYVFLCKNCDHFRHKFQTFSILGMIDKIYRK